MWEAVPKKHQGRGRKRKNIEKERGARREERAEGGKKTKS